MLNLFFKNKNHKHTCNDVGTYYDEWTERYLEVGGNAIQAFRTKEIEDLYDYVIDSAGFKSGMKLLDAGCGVCGPAEYFANKIKLIKIDAVTNSQKQLEIAKERLFSNEVSNINVVLGDYHVLGNTMKNTDYDGVYFLESMGHAYSTTQVLDSVWSVLKPGGFIYIKDFFRKESNDANFQKKINDVVANINKLYFYNTLELNEVISNARKIGFEINFIQKMNFIDDIEVRAVFESKNGINIFGNYEPFIPTDWLELKFYKPL